jgi:riboflavin synthase
MFTGIVTAIGMIEDREERGDLRLRIACPFDPDKIAVGASIACAGVCLTVVERGGTAGTASFAVDVSAETLSRTAKGTWAEGARLNLEGSLKVGDELGGHIVSGHVDAVGTIVDRAGEGDSIRLTIEAPAQLAPFIAAKGSIAVDGVSLSVNEVADQPGGTVRFGLNVIPHTSIDTTLGDLVLGDEVNLEIDTVARYLQRLESLRA